MISAATFNTSFDLGYIVVDQNIRKYPRRGFFSRARANFATQVVTIDETESVADEELMVQTAERRERNLAIGLIRRMAKDGLSWSDTNDTKITIDTANAAIAFIRNLSPSETLPKLSPDGEGRLILAWEGNHDPLIAVIDDWRIHLVNAATTPRARYWDNVPFDGETIPEFVLGLIPQT